MTKIHKLCFHFWKFIFKKGRRKYLENYFKYIYIYIYFKTIVKVGIQQQAAGIEKDLVIIVVGIFPKIKLIFENAQ